MLGAVIGDIAGSMYEFDNHRHKDISIFGRGNFFTDDSIMTLAVAKAIIESGKDLQALYRNAVRYMHDIGRDYIDADYGRRFRDWLESDCPFPYGSCGNGSAMRVSAVSWAAGSIADCKALSHAVTFPTHNHPEGLKGAECAAVCGFLARTGSSKDEIRECVEKHYYSLDFTIDGIRPKYEFGEVCQNTVPEAVEAFLEAESFEDAIRTAVSVGGDSDTLAAITGGIAECFWGIPRAMREKAFGKLDDRLSGIVREFEEIYPPVVTD